MVSLALVSFALGVACQGTAAVPGNSGTPTPEDGLTGRLDTSEGGDPGIFDDEVVFGQSAAFSGPSQVLGKGMRLGIEAAFHEVNAAGGVHGRRLVLETLDDGYEPDIALENTNHLIEKSEVFALIGAVGTPTSRVAAPLAQAAGVPFIAPFTGAEFLRGPEFDNVLNVRASYYQETEEMVTRLTEDLGITRVAVLYQNDSFGQNGLDGATLALERRGLRPVSSGHYERNTSAVKAAVADILAGEPEAIIMIGSHAAVTRAIQLVRREARPVFMTVSFVGSRALAKALAPDIENVYITQVVPQPHNEADPVVASYHAALANYDARAQPEYVSLEGYLAGRLAIFGLESCLRDLTRECFIQALHTDRVVDIDGMQLEFGPHDNQGSDAVFVTAIDPDASLRQVQRLTASP